MNKSLEICIKPNYLFHTFPFFKFSFIFSSLSENAAKTYLHNIGLPPHLTTRIIFSEGAELYSLGDEIFIFLPIVLDEWNWKVASFGERCRKKLWKLYGN